MSLRTETVFNSHQNVGYSFRHPTRTAIIIRFYFNPVSFIFVVFLLMFSRIHIRMFANFPLVWIVHSLMVPILLMSHLRILKKVFTIIWRWGGGAVRRVSEHEYMNTWTHEYMTTALSAIATTPWRFTHASLEPFNSCFSLWLFLQRSLWPWVY